MKYNIFLIAVVAVAVFVFNSCGTTDNANTRSANPANMNTGVGNAVNTVSNTVGNMANSVSAGMDDSEFMTEAAYGGLAEVEFGRLAVTKAADAEVKKFAQMMVDDHSKANEELKPLAAKKGVKIPVAMNDAHRATMEDLRGKVGADFDRAYVEAMVDDHEKDVSMFEDMSNDAADPDVKAFAAKTLPVLRKHLEAIKAIEEKLE